jgi:hypothetical protein
MYYLFILFNKFRKSDAQENGVNGEVRWSSWQHDAKLRKNMSLTFLWHAFFTGGPQVLHVGMMMWMPH